GRLTAARAGSPLRACVDKRIEKMIHVSRAVRHRDGRIPQFGDGDSGRILPAGFARPATHDHLLWLGAATVTRERPLPGPVSEEVAWTVGVDAWRKADGLPSAGAPPSGFPAGGVYV